MKTNILLNRPASMLAFIIGGMAVFAGGQVLLGKDSGYFVISWLIVYNYALGILTVFITTIWIWKNSWYALLAALTTIGLHTLVMLILHGLQECSSGRKHSGDDHSPGSLDLDPGIDVLPTA